MAVLAKTRKQENPLAPPRKSFYTTESIKAVRNSFKIGQKIKLKVECSRGKYRLVKGTVIDKTDCLVAVKKEVGTESFRYAEFRAGEVKVVGV